MRQRVLAQRVTEAAGRFGEPARTWASLEWMWADVEWEGGRETFLADREFATVPVTVTVNLGGKARSLREKDRWLLPMGHSRLTSAIANSTATSLVVTSADAFPPEHPYAVRVQDELCVVASASGTTLTVARGSYGTTAAKHPASSAVLHMTPADIESVSPQGRDLVTLALRAEVGPST